MKNYYIAALLLSQIFCVICAPKSRTSFRELFDEFKNNMKDPELDTIINSAVPEKNQFKSNQPIHNTIALSLTGIVSFALGIGCSNFYQNKKRNSENPHKK